MTGVQASLPATPRFSAASYFSNIETGFALMQAEGPRSSRNHFE